MSSKTMEQCYIQNFPLPRLLALPMLKIPVYATICTYWLRRKDGFMPLSYTTYIHMQNTQYKYTGKLRCLGKNVLLFTSNFGSSTRGERYNS